MASDIYATTQSTGEIRIHYVDFTDDLPTGVTVTAGSVALSGYPAGGTATVTAGTVSSNVLPVTVSGATAAGVYTVDVRGTLSSNEVSIARLIIPMNWAAVRAGMADLLLELRGMTNAGHNDYTVAGVSYWSDKHLMDYLDRHRTEVVEEELQYIEENNNGTTLVTRYYSRHGNYEQTTGGTAVFVIRDSDYDAVGTASYTPDYTRGEVIFGSHTAGSAYYLTGRSYNLYAAAADVWERKAAQAAAGAFTWSTDNMRIDKSGLRKEYLQQANYYRMMAGPAATDLIRGDGDAY